jgi:hypothetical protein
MRASRARTARKLHSLLAAAALTAAMVAANHTPQDGSTRALAASAPHPVATSLQTIPLPAAGKDVDPGPTAAVPQATREQVAGASSLRPVVSSKPISTRPFSLVAVTWTGTFDDDGVVAYARTRSHGSWTPWFALASEGAEHAPDPGTAESRRARQGTAPLLGARSDGVQVRVDTRSGTAPQDLRIDLVDAGASDADGTSMALALAMPSTVVSLSTSPKPPIRSRAAWGADESKVKEAPSYGTVKGGFVHHTVNSNSYSMADVPALIRSIYAYHVDSMGWNDIGYNFIVDRFGQIWEGRKGGVDRAVIGAHTSGFNSQGFAMAALGTYTDTRAADAVITAYVQLFAWKFSIHGVDPRSTTYYNTNGNYAISGHRDMGSTECPGDALYGQLGTIRSEVVARMGPFPRFGLLEAVGDANGDGSADVAGVGSDGILRMYFGNRSTGLFASTAEWGAGWNTLDRLLGVGDWNGDGNDDLVGRDRRTGELFLYTGPGRSGDRFTSKTRIGTGWRLFDNVEAAGDLTGDGFPDIVANDNDGKLWIYPGNGIGGFLPRYLMGSGWYTINEITAGGDYNHDGHDDIVGRSTSGELFIYLGPGAPNRGFTARIAAGTGFNAFDTFIGPGNWTPDDKPDLIMRDDTTNQLRLYYGRGAQGFLRGRVINSGW